MTKYRRIRNSTNGSLSPFFVKLLLQRWHEGLKSPESSVLSTSRSSRGSSVTLVPRRRALDPTSGSEDNVVWWFLMQTISHTESCQAFYRAAPIPPIGLKTTEAPCGRFHRWINRGEISTAERNPLTAPTSLTQDSRCCTRCPLCLVILVDPGSPGLETFSGLERVLLWSKT